MMESVVLLLLCISAAAAMPAGEGGQGADAGAADYKSKVDSPRIQYMLDLQSSVADENGNPRAEDLTASPTSVFCLADYGEIVVATVNY